MKSHIRYRADDDKSAVHIVKYAAGFSLTNSVLPVRAGKLCENTLISSAALYSRGIAVKAMPLFLKG
ncbi:MAG: hypothetical protein EOM34_06600 [Clostridia bacterium]|nr:hypothetical protein [Lachnospiraceae bacterium]NCC00334.1 hypothetical protein [Clostridia bacterium]NCD02974.1 hypothetical protein [Clostridia bacterium]